MSPPAQGCRRKHLPSETKHSSGKCRPYQALRKAARLPLFLKQGSQAMPALPTLISTAPPHPNEASFQTFA